MPDPRWDALAEILIDHSTRLAAGETLLIECFDLDDSTLPRLLVRKAARQGAYPLVETKDTRHRPRAGPPRLARPQMRTWGEIELHRMERVQAYIGLRGARNISEMADVPAEKMDLYNTHYPEAGPLRVPDQADQLVRPPPAQRRAWPSRPG